MDLAVLALPVKTSYKAVTSPSGPSIVGGMPLLKIIGII
jgi:hypothetical protein